MKSKLLRWSGIRWSGIRWSGFVIPTLIIFIIIISSCNSSQKTFSSGFIQKRKYNKGYHIEWIANKGNSHLPNSKKEKLVAKDKPSVIQQNNSPEKKDTTTISSTIIPQKVDDKVTASIDNTTPFIYQPIPFIIQENDSLEKKNSDSIKDNRITNENAKKGFILSLLGLVFGAFIIPTIGIIYCIKGQNEIVKDPSKYKNKGFVIAGILICIIDIIWDIFLLIILIHLLAFLSM